MFGDPKVWESHIYENLSFGPGENGGVNLIQIWIAGGWWLIYFCFAHHQLFSQSQDQIPELLDFCKCFVIELKRLHCSSFESNPLKSCNTMAAQYTCWLYICQDNFYCLHQKSIFLSFLSYCLVKAIWIKIATSCINMESSICRTNRGFRYIWAGLDLKGPKIHQNQWKPWLLQRLTFCTANNNHHRIYGLL